MTTDEVTSAPSWRRRLARPFLMLGLIGGAALFLPRMIRHEVRFLPSPTDARCVRYARVALKHEGELLRVFKVSAMEEGRFMAHSIELSEGVYQTALSLECEDGSVTESETQPVTVDSPGTVHLRIRSRCDCAADD